MKKNNLLTRMKKTLVGGISALAVVACIAVYGVCNTVAIDSETNSLIATTDNKTNTTTNDPVIIQVQASMLKTPLARTSDETEMENTIEKDNMYSVEMVNTYEEKSVDVNGGELLESGAARRYNEKSKN